jgi:hypothetical protein
MTAPDHAFLTGVQKDSFACFVHEVNEANGLVADKTAHHWPASIAAVGMALTVYTIGAERGFMARGRAAQRTLTTLRFFANSEQSESPGACPSLKLGLLRAGFRGGWLDDAAREAG